MSAVPITRTCLDCRSSFTVFGWQLDGLCGGCREKQRAKDISRTICSGCGCAITPAPGRTQCLSCWEAEHATAVQKWGAE